MAEVTADAGEERALAYIEALRAYQPAEADACLARLRLRLGSHEAALLALESAFAAYRGDPWPSPLVMQGALDAALELAGQKPELAPRVLAALRPEFALRMLNEVRVEEAFLVGSLGEPGAGLRAAPRAGSSRTSPSPSRGSTTACAATRGPTTPASSRPGTTSSASRRGPEPLLPPGK